MKNSFKLVLVIPFLAVLFLAMTKESYNAPVPNQNEEVNTTYSITVFTNPPCYTGTCTAKRLSDNTVFQVPISGACYTTPDQGLTYGTYLVTVCCNGRSGSGYVTIPPNQAYITVNLTGYCEGSGQD